MGAANQFPAEGIHRHSRDFRRKSFFSINFAHRFVNKNGSKRAQPGPWHRQPRYARCSPRSAAPMFRRQNSVPLTQAFCIRRRGLCRQALSTRCCMTAGSARLLHTQDNARQRVKSARVPQQIHTFAARAPRRHCWLPHVHAMAELRFQSEATSTPVKRFFVPKTLCQANSRPNQARPFGSTKYSQPIRHLQKSPSS